MSSKRYKVFNKGIQFLLLDLWNYFNNDGISYDSLKCDGAFDGSGATFPAEELPQSNSFISVDGIPFLFPSKENGNKNNMIIRKQEMLLDEQKYDKLYILGASEGQAGDNLKEEIAIMNGNKIITIAYAGLSNWLLTSVFDEKAAFCCSHFHIPDYMQKVNRNLFTKNELQEYDTASDPVEYFSEVFDKAVFDKLPSGDWKPKIWFQEIVLPYSQAVNKIKFKNENLNFHIFAMTFKINEAV
ncbi:MAG: hypothetical protein FWG57_05610 [Endomicrobia bacterium]|nr:hypothetical protein [Endomicrobiia bacterium]